MTQIDSSVKQKRVAEALLQMAQESPQELGPYLSKRLTTHVAQANLWNQLAAAADVLDAVDLESLVSDVLANTFGARELPLPLAATITVRHLIASNHPQARVSYRIFGQAQLAGFARAGSASSDLEIGAINWAWRFRRDSVTIPLSGHTRPVTALASVGLAGGRTLLASGDSDGTLRLWDPATGASAGDPLTGHSLALAALATISVPGEHTLLVSSGWDGTVRLWNPATGTQTGQLRTGDIGQVRAVTAVDAPDGRTLLATGGSDGAVRLWDPATGLQARRPLTRHRGPVRALTTFSLLGRIFLASGGADGVVWLWEATSSRRRGEWPGTPIRAQGQAFFSEL